MPHRRTAVWSAALMLAVIARVGTAHAQTIEEEIKAMRQEIDALRRSEAEKQRQLDELQRRLDQLEAQPPAVQPSVAVPAPEQPAAAATPAQAKSALDRAIEELGTPPTATAAPRPDLWSQQVGSTTLKLVDISFDVLTAAGTSTATDSELSSLEAGAHDPNQRGFTLQQAELGLAGAVDPYLRGDAFIVYAPNSVELEEAYMTTLSLPYDLQGKAGYYLTEFGIINPTHPHAWDWIDQPVISSRLFGGDGLRSPGARLAWLLPVPWYAEVFAGVQNADEGEFTLSFIGDNPTIGMRPGVDRPISTLSDMLYAGRWENFVNLTDTVGAKFGVSGLYGPNNTGGAGQTWTYGGDLKLRWRPADNFRGWPFLTWQTEAMKRDYTAARFVSPTETLPRAILRDYGFYSQLLYGFYYRWAGGLRLEYATGVGQSVGGRANDPFRDDRFRLSPLLVWQPTEFSRFRLQYNYDNAHTAPVDDANTVWLGAEILYGAHPAHKY